MVGRTRLQEILLTLTCIFCATARSAAQLKQATIELYLSNSTLDDYPDREDANTAYFGVLDVGTPGKQFTGCFDTGSADAWLPLSSCTSQACQSHNTFSPDTSSTYSASSTQFSIQYATGAVYGTLAYDTVTLGGISIPNQALGVVRQAGKELLQSSCDGIIGFGFQALSQLDAPAPFFSMVQDSLLTQNTFSFWFSQVYGAEPAGELVIGGVNPSRLTGSATFIPVPNSTYWSLPLRGALVAGQNVALGAATAVLDSSSTAISMGQADCQALHAQIPGAVFWDNAGLYNISGGCNGISRQPSVSIKLGNQTYAIPPSLWVIKYQGACVSGFVPVLSANQIVLGVPFLRAWHTQYSYDPASQVARIGLATPTAVPSLSSGAVQSSSTAFAGRRLTSQASTEPQDSEPQTQVFGASIPSAKDRGIQ